jgi:2-polyprenyl-3-methyl-5-hydroxy-6-metoxy-1,4-benzoquinol methylase
MKAAATHTVREMHAKDPGYHAHLNAALLAAIPPDAAMVLEIGCGTGALGAAHKGRNPDARVHGVEIQPAAAAAAAQVLDMVLCCGAETADLGFLEGRVDCLVYGDVLQHMADPWAVLARDRALLSDTGLVVASIPNVQHWSLIEHLLRGHWTYSDQGLLDTAHLRFFTYESIVAMFDAAGLEIGRTLGLLNTPERATALAESLAPALMALGVDTAQFARTSGPLQYLVTATPR